MSELTTKLRDMMTTLERPDGGAASLLLQAAVRIEELERDTRNVIIDNLQAEVGSVRLDARRLHTENDRLRGEISRLRDEIRLEQQKNKPLKEQLEQANKIIEDIAKAAECDNFADVILARVTAQNQQSNAMTRICEGHIATSRRETAKADDYLKANKELSGRIDVLNNQGNKMQHLLHAIADKLGAGSRSAIPAEDWYLARIDQIACNYRDYLGIISDAVGKPDLSYKDLADYFRGLDVEGLKKIADKANEFQGEMQKLAGKLAVAERYVETRDISLNQLAQALKVDQSRNGWATTMLNKAEHLMSTVNSKDYKWDKEKTDALQKLLQKFGMWPTHNNVEGLEKFSTFVTNMMTELDQATSRMVAKNNRISELEHENDRLITESGGGRKAQTELDLAVGAIRRMHTKLLENKPRTGIWPADGTFRAKLDDIEWCLYVYIGRVIADGQLHEADTKFIADVRDSLSFEILRRNKQ